MVGVDDIVAFLTARLDEDEAVAKEATPGPWEIDLAPDGRWYIDPGADRDDVGDIYRRKDATHIARHDPARVLAEVAAKRAILAAVDKYRDPHPGIPCTNVDDRWVECELHTAATGRVEPYALQILAAVYADHEDYRDGWRP